MEKKLLITVLLMGLSTVAGTAAGLLFRKIPDRFYAVIPGMSAGIMLGSAILGLILPSVRTAGAADILLSLAGVASGSVLLSTLDRVVPHLHRLAGLDREKHPDRRGADRVLLFIAAIAIHKLPEGLASGVSFGTGNEADILTVAGGITLQNIPEAMAVAAPLLSIGVSVARTMAFSLLTGMLAMFGTAGGYLFVAAAGVLTPFFLGFAGGSMLYVVSDEMIPETHSRGKEKPATFALIAGFMLIAALQKLLQ